MRTAGRWPPLMLTSPTPASCEIFVREPRVGEILDLRQRHRASSVSASVTIGVSAGLTLL